VRAKKDVSACATAAADVAGAVVTSRPPSCAVGSSTSGDFDGRDEFSVMLARALAAEDESEAEGEVEALPLHVGQVVRRVFTLQTRRGAVEIPHV
jgi:hypothetical protein